MCKECKIWTANKQPSPVHSVNLVMSRSMQCSQHSYAADYQQESAKRKQFPWAEQKEYLPLEDTVFAFHHIYEHLALIGFWDYMCLVCIFCVFMRAVNSTATRPCQQVKKKCQQIYLDSFFSQVIYPGVDPPPLFTGPLPLASQCICIQ